LLRATGLLLGVAPILASGAPPVAPTKSVRLYVIDCGVLLYNDLQRFGYKKGEISPTNLSNGCYLIVHPMKGTLIWDTGVVPDNLWKDEKAPPKKEYAEGTIPLKKQLEQIGYEPEDIKFVAVSHAHWDHVANLYEFSHDTWLVSAYTRDKLLGAHPPDKTDASMFTPLRDTRTITLPDDKSYDVFGDGSAVIIPTPGHTPDSRVLLVNLKKTGPIVLSGDLYHFLKDIKTNNVLPNENRPQSLHSREEIQQLLKSDHGTLWVNHDYTQFSKLKKSPNYYD
jgi:glyoxylase-like metal-dependent hydrolase (beta-lactamase superfamily II)